MGFPVLAVGNDPAWRARLERMLSLRWELDWGGAVASDALRSVRVHQGALWLVDGDDPVAERVCSRLCPDQPIRIHFYLKPDVATLTRCLQIGGSGCLNKNASRALVLKAVREVGDGLFAVERGLLISALGRRAPAIPGAPAQPDDQAARWPQLTPRQRQIVHLTTQGLSNKQIGRHLGISPETVKSHLHHVFKSARVSGRVSLLALAAEPAGAALEESEAAAIKRVRTSDRRSRDDRRRRVQSEGLRPRPR